MVAMSGEVVFRNLRNPPSRIKRNLKRRIRSWVCQHDKEFEKGGLYYSITFDRHQDPDTQSNSGLECQVNIISDASFWVGCEMGGNFPQALSKCLSNMIPMSELDLIGKERVWV
ncbi:MAG: hypothetical protein AABZ06_01700 [Bdellovibrionota bacterium]